MKGLKWFLEKVKSLGDYPKSKYGIYMSSICVAALATAVFWHFSLPAYYCFSLFVIVLSAWYLRHYRINTQSGDDTKAISIFTVTTITILSFFVFETYYNAKDNVFHNVSHHALALKGYTLADEGILFGNDRTALLEDTATSDVLSYQLQRGPQGNITAIRLKSDNFNRSFFVREKGGKMAVNKNTGLVPLKDGITFKKEVKEEGNRYLRFSLRESKDSASYLFTLFDGKGNEQLCEESAYHGFIQKSYPLEDLIPSAVAAQFHDKLQGYTITRDQYSRDESAREDDLTILGIERLSRLSFRKHPFVIEQTGNVTSAIVTGTPAGKTPFDITVSPGDQFFISFGKASTTVLSLNEKGQLLFSLPMHRPLPDDKDICQVFVSTSDAQICKGRADYNIYYPVSQSEQNKNLFNLTVSFKRGQTTQPLYITVNNDSIRKAGQDFFIKSDRSQHEAILSLVDFKANTVFNVSHFRQHLFILFLLCILCLCINRQANKDEGKRFAPTAELACIILLLVFFTTRYLLCWRISVFPPLEDITRFEYDIYQNRGVFNWIWGMIALIAVMILIKVVCLCWHPDERRWQNSPSIMTAIGVAVYAMACLGAMIFSSGFTHILIPVMSYFLIEVLISRYYSARTDRPLMADAFLLKRPFFINFSAHLALLTISDTGYGVMFFFFGLIRYFLLLVEYVVILFKTTDSNEEIGWLRYFPTRWPMYVRLIVLVFLGCLGVTIFFLLSSVQYILCWGMNSAWFGFLLIGSAIIAVAIFLGWLCIPIRNWIRYRHRNWLTPVTAGCVVIVIVCLGFVPYFYNHTIGPDTKQIHIRYRTKVLVEEWNNILNNEKMSNAKNIARFRQTSENQWILDHYYQNRIGFSDDYFKLQPMNKTGAMWGAQATDISFLRFGIAEHGSMYALFIFVLLLTALVIVIRQPRYVYDNRQIAYHHIATGAILLIVLQAVFVWMSVTNRFIFFGQDFPMLSITSKSSLFYFSFLLFLAIILMIPTEESEDPSQTPYYKSVQKWISFGVCCFFVAFGTVVYFYAGKDRENKNKQSYELQLNQVQKVLRQHNTMLHYFQLYENATLMKKANAFIVGDNQGRNRYGQDLFLQFNSELYNNIETDENTLSNDCVIVLPQDSTQKFPLVGSRLALHDEFLKLAQKKAGDIGLAYGKDSVTVTFKLANEDKYSHEELRLFHEINHLFTIYQVENAGLRNANLAVFNRRDIGQEAKILAGEIKNKLENINLTRMMQEYTTFLTSHSNDSIIRFCQDSLSRISGAVFVKSLVDAYTSHYSKDNNPDDLIFLSRNRLTHFLEFSINRFFFNIPEFNKPIWKGNIIADSKYGNNILMIREGKQYNGDAVINDHFSDFRVPRAWLPPSYSNDDQFAFRSFAPINLRLNGLQHISLPHNGYSSIRLSGMDVLSIKEAHNVPKAHLPSGDYHTFAKNIWFNGHRRMIYTLGERLPWLGSYEKFLAAVMTDSAKVVPSALSDNHQISLDYDLSERLYDIMNKTHILADDALYRIVNKNSKNPSIPKEELRHKFCVFVGNSDGQVVAMPDFNADSTFRISPNDLNAIYSKRKRIRLFAIYSDERSLYGNYNLLPLQFGPGSSLKPLSFSAVSAAYDNNWNSFTLESIVDPCIVYQYAGKEFNRGEYFASISSDEPGKNHPSYHVSDYLARSSNFFNSAIIFIGSFSKESLQEGIFKRVKYLQKDHSAEFPVMRIELGSRSSYYAFDKIPEPRGRDSRPILMESFMENFELYNRPLLADANYMNKFILEPELRQGVLHRNPNGKTIYEEQWIAPEPSYLDFPLWSDPSQVSYAQRIKTLTLGMRRVVSVSPMKMAEMYSRLFLLDKNFRYTLSTKPYISHVDFKTPAYESVGVYLQMLKGDHSLFAGMSKCAESGTASYLRKVCAKYNETHKSKIFFYAKTGTINDASLDRKMSISLNDALLAVVIANADMQKAEIKDGRMTVNGRPVKFYVVYAFMDKSAKGMGTVKSRFYEEVFNAICSSRRFQMFMNNNE